jgi:uncharacterized protein (TIGR00255 family)
MTGFGAALTETNGYRTRLEIKTLNNRYREFVLRAPHAIGAFEEPLKKIILSKISRGRIEVWAQTEKLNSPGQLNFTVNREAITQIVALLQDIATTNSLAGPITLEQLLKFERFFLLDEPTTPEELDPDLFWPPLKTLTETALAQLLDMRRQEGIALKNDIDEHITNMELSLKELKGIASAIPASLCKRYQTRLEELAATLIEPSRIAQEAAILGEKMDITEEITRFTSHLKNFRVLLDASDPAGRRMEFLLQELLRETNTMGSKSQTLPITEIVLFFKSELEKIREQVLNIE